MKVAQQSDAGNGRPGVDDHLRPDSQVDDGSAADRDEFREYVDSGQPGGEAQVDDEQQPDKSQSSDLAALTEQVKTLSSRFERSEEARIRAEQEATQWRGAYLNARDGVGDRQAPPAKDKPQPKFNYDRSGLESKLKDDPAGTILELFTNFGEDIRATVTDAITGATTKTKETVDTENRVRSAMQADRQEALDTYGALYDDPELGEEFWKAADQEFQRLRQMRGVQIGDFTLAAERAFGKWVRTGKLPADWFQSHGAGERANDRNNATRGEDRQRVSTTQPRLREIVRRPVGSTDQGGSRAGGAGGRGGAPKTVDECLSDPVERRVARRVIRENASQMNITEQQAEARWVANFNAAKAADASYGRE